MASLSAVSDDDRSTPTYTYAIVSGASGKFALDGTTPNQINLVDDIEPDHPDDEAYVYVHTCVQIHR